MTAPRPVFCDRCYMLTRRCTQRQFLLRPDEETNNAFLYCLGWAANRYGIVVLLPQMMSNHHHTVVFDPDGRINEFTEQFHAMLAKCQNALRGRWENMWATEQPCRVELVDARAVMDRLVYTATNPVKDGLVERVHHWPGPKTVSALLNGQPLRARRPRHFFREDGSMPEFIELNLTIPPELGDREQIVAELRERIAAEEAEQQQERLRTGRQVLGRGRVLRHSWRDCPTSGEPRRGIRPQVAGSKWARVERLQRNKEFLAAYRRARTAWLAGEPAVFPAGTFWLRRFANVPIESDLLN